MHLADRCGCRWRVAKRGELLSPVVAELGGHHAVHDRRWHWRGRVLQLGERLPVRADQLIGEGGLEDAHGLAEFHGPALELAKDCEDLVGGTPLHLVEHSLRRGADDALSHAERRTAGEPHGQRREPSSTREGAPAQRATGWLLVVCHRVRIVRRT